MAWLYGGEKMYALTMHQADDVDDHVMSSAGVTSRGDLAQPVASLLSRVALTVFYFHFQNLLPLPQFTYHVRC